MPNIDSIDTTVPTLGSAKISSPIHRKVGPTRAEPFVTDSTRVLIDVNTRRTIRRIQNGQEPPSFEVGGPRERIFFDPSKLRCALVTCGGLCPGLNDIIRSIVLELHFGYNVRNIYGIRYGLKGFIPEYGLDVMDLNPGTVGNIHQMGGSVLGSSRGPQDIDSIVDSLERMNIGILFMIGGDGTLKAATLISDTIAKRGLKISVIGVPKTIDNDIYLVSRSFGFDTAVELSSQAIKGAHNEALGYPNGIGLIKLMGRHSGFIAATAALAQQDVNFVLIPEVDFDMEGENGLLGALERRLARRGHAVIVAAEGAGQHHVEGENRDRDASGNIKLKDIGGFLRDRITVYFREKEIDISLKYIDPSYMIRSLPANANDHVFCGFLGRGAVHAGMAGKTKMLYGNWHDHFVHIPMTASVGHRKQVSPDGTLWQSVLDATGQGSLKNS